MATVISTLAVQLTARTKPFTKRLSLAAKRVAAFAKKVGGALRKLLKFGSVMTALSLGALALFLRQQFKIIDATVKFADTIGLTFNELTAFQQAAKISGIQTEALNKGIGRLLKNIADAGDELSTSKRAFDKLGISFKELRKLSTAEIFKRTITGLGRLEDQSDKAQISLQLFGRTGLGLLKLSKLGEKGFREFEKSVERLGLTMSRLDAAQIEAANDAIQRLKDSLIGIIRTIAVKLAPKVNAFAKGLTSAFVAFRKNILPRVIGFIARQADFLLERLNAILPDIIAFVRAIGAAFGLLKRIAVSALNLIIKVLNKFGVRVKTGADVFDKFIGIITRGFVLLKFIFDNFETIIELVLAKIELFFLTIRDNISRFVNLFIPKLLNKLKGKIKDVLPDLLGAKIEIRPEEDIEKSFISPFAEQLKKASSIVERLENRLATNLNKATQDQANAVKKFGDPIISFLQSVRKGITATITKTKAEIMASESRAASTVGELKKIEKRITSRRLEALEFGTAAAFEAERAQRIDPQKETANNTATLVEEQKKTNEILAENLPKFMPIPLKEVEIF